MNIPLTLRILGALLLFLAIALLIPLPFSWFYEDGVASAFVIWRFLIPIDRFDCTGDCGLEQQRMNVLIVEPFGDLVEPVDVASEG